MHAQRLPTARGMGDVDSVAHVLFSTARIQLQRGDHNRDGLQTINENLSEAFAISSKSGRINAVAAIGTLLAQVLAMGGETDRALEALGDAEAAYLKLGRQQGIEHVQELRRLIDQQRPTL